MSAVAADGMTSPSADHVEDMCRMEICSFCGWHAGQSYNQLRSIRRLAVRVPTLQPLQKTFLRTGCTIGRQSPLSLSRAVEGFPACCRVATYVRHGAR